MHHPELYLPATPRQLNQFAGKLDRAVLRITGMVTEFENLQIDHKVFLAENEFLSVGFNYGQEGEDNGVQMDTYRIEIGHVLPVSKSESPEPILAQLRDYLEMTDEDIERMQSNIQEAIGEEIELGDLVEGYVEYENSISIQKIGRLVKGNKMHMVNFMDDEFTVVESELGVIGDTTGVKGDDVFLVDDRLIELDTHMLEYDLSQPTGADLILAAKALMAVGILSTRVIPFKGAEKYMDLVSLTPVTPT